MKWPEILKYYPDQWVSLVHVEKDINGEIRSAIVTASAPNLKLLTQRLKKTHQPSDRFEYTGAIKNFLGFARWTIEGNDDVPTSK
jgi:hypothetical protein